jgi:hypothetical protein
MNMARMNKVGNHATTVWGENGTTYIKYHATIVVEFDQDTLTLRTGGWRTVTTKLRMNQASNQFGLGFHVWQKNFDWYVSYQGKEISFNEETIKIMR